MWLILLIPLLLLLVFCPTADAGVPSAINSSVPWTMYVCPQGDLHTRIVVRDGSNATIAGSMVRIQIPQDWMRSICRLDSLCALEHICVQSDSHGVVDLSIPGGGSSAARVSVIADGQLIGTMGLGSTDQNGDLEVDEMDFAIAAAAESLAGAGASDFDGDGTTTESDLAILRSHLGHRCSGVPPPPVPAPGTSATWVRLFPSGDFVGRAYASALYDPLRHRVVVFGGENFNDRPFWPDGGLFNEVRELSFVGEPVWRRLDVAAPGPWRIDHAVALDSRRNRMLVFGGSKPAAIDEGSSYTNDTWSFDLAGPSLWEYLNATAPPPERFSAIAAYDPARDRLVVFGGAYIWHRSYVYALGDLWELPLGDGLAWRQLSPVGTAPALALFVGAYDSQRDRLLIYDSQGSTMYALTLEDPPTWSLLSAVAPPAPAAASQGRLFDDPVRDRALLLLGSGLYALDFKTEPPAWRPLNMVGGPIEPPAGAAAAYDPIDDQIVFVGGLVRCVLPPTNACYSSTVRALRLGQPARRVTMDIRPGSPVNTIQRDSRGLLPVALFGATGFPVSGIDLASVRLAGAPPSERGGGQPRVDLRDINGDGITDALLQFDVEDLTLTEQDKTAFLFGRMLDGSPFVGEDEVRVRGSGPGTAMANPGASPDPAPSLEIQAARFEGTGLRMTLQLPATKRTTIEVFDIGGRRVARRDLENVSRGIQDVRAPNLVRTSPGLYFVRVSQSGRAAARKLVVVH